MGTQPHHHHAPCIGSQHPIPSSGVLDILRALMPVSYHGFPHRNTTSPRFPITRDSGSRPRRTQGQAIIYGSFPGANKRLYWFPMVSYNSQFRLIVGLKLPRKWRPIIHMYGTYCIFIRISRTRKLFLVARYFTALLLQPAPFHFSHYTMFLLYKLPYYR